MMAHSKIYDHYMYTQIINIQIFLFFFVMYRNESKEHKFQ